MNDTTSTLILIDPTAPDGEGGLSLVERDDAAVTLLLLLGDPSAAAVEEFARAEDIAVSEAADRYLAQVAQRVGAGWRVEAVSTVGTDAVVEILATVAATAPRRVVVPASLPGLHDRSLARLVHASPVPIVVAPALAA